jgi:non-ribosomal peptide synthetase component F
MHKHKSGGQLSIGKPVANTNVYILDENERPVSIGQMGLMWVGGAGVSSGYLNLTELTSTRYKHDKFVNDGYEGVLILLIDSS